MTQKIEEVTVVTKEGIPKDLQESSKQPLYKSQDFAVWLTSIVLFLVLTAAIVGLGDWRQWDAQSGYTHNTSMTSSQRFLPEPFIEEPGVKGRYGSGCTGRWYYWKLPPDDVTWLTRLVIWVCYITHQFTVWIILYVAQRKQNESSAVEYRHNVRWWNVWLFVVNVVFHALHLAQTHWTYDALAQDTSITSSQGSVVVMLTFITVLEYRDRGLVFGWPSQYSSDRVANKLKLPYSSMYLVRKYHGYGFAWAAVYTMWYHPMENTIGHLAGFFHTYIIMVQASLIYTPMHLNKYWRFLLEAWVAVHGTVVAVQTGGPQQMGTQLWPMFCFGFSIMVCVTQLFGLPFWRRLPVATRFLPITALAVVIVGMYSWIPDREGRPWRRMYEVVFIPIILILLPVLIFAMIYGLLKIEACLKKQQDNKNTNIFTQILFYFLAMSSYLACVAIGFCVQYFDVLLDITVMQNFVYIIYSVLICVAIMFMKQAFNEKMVTGVTEVVMDVIDDNHAKNT